MNNDDEEVIDVEKFHQDSERKSFHEINRKNQKLKDENKSLDIKANNLRYANDALRHKLFEQDQRHNKIARLLGFDDVESMEASMASKEPLNSHSSVALSDARARILLLEGELAKHVTANTETQAVIKGIEQQLKRSLQQLGEADADTRRLRAERDLARQQAVNHAIDAKKWRLEVQTTLPELQSLVRELQQRNQVQAISCPTTGDEKINLAAVKGGHSIGLLRDVANTISLTEDHSCAPSTARLSDAQYYKQKFELLEAQYNALLDKKEKISKRYREELTRWKEFKSWIVKDNAESEHKTSSQRRVRVLRRRKAIEKIGPHLEHQNMEMNGDTAAAEPREDANKSLVDPSREGSNLNDYEVANIARSPVPHSTVTSERKQYLNPPSDPFPLGESLTQASSLPQCEHLTTTAPNSHPTTSTTIKYQGISNDHDSEPLLQESLTQPSSVPSFSSIQEPIDTLHVSTRKSRPKIITIDSSPERNLILTKHESPEKLLIRGTEEPSKPQATDNPHTPLLNSNFNTPTSSKLQRAHELTGPTIFVQPLRTPDTSRAGMIKQTRTVLAVDTPPSTIVRHHSSPPDSPHVQRLNKGKRKVAEMEKEGDDGIGSDPFRAGPYTVRTNSTMVQTREERMAHLKALNNKSHKEYIAEYMPFKGRGRYSNTNRVADKTVNGEFEIDPERNNGLVFQYDAVVRDKTKRKTLQAGDCECCQEYYDAIGSLPPRLQAPLWKSPSSDLSQHSSRPCRYQINGHEDEGIMSSPTKPRAKAIEAHKRDVSRHRHNWAPPTTPPDFWKISFPDTQTVDDINQRANDMHARKFDRIEAEANSSNGRYRKRK